MFAFLFVIFSNGKAKSLFVPWKLESINNLNIDFVLASILLIVIYFSRSSYFALL